MVKTGNANHCQRAAAHGLRRSSASFSGLRGECSQGQPRLLRRAERFDPESIEVRHAGEIRQLPCRFEGLQKIREVGAVLDELRQYRRRTPGMNGGRGGEPLGADQPLHRREVGPQRIHAAFHHGVAIHREARLSRERRDQSIRFV